MFFFALVFSTAVQQPFNSLREQLQSAVTNSHCKITVAVSISNTLQNDGSSLILQTISTTEDDLRRSNYDGASSGLLIVKWRIGNLNWLQEHFASLKQ